MAERGRVHQRRSAVASGPPPLQETGPTLTTVGDPEPMHELEVDPPEFPDEVVDSVPVSLGDLDVGEGYASVAPPADPGPSAEPEKPKKTRKKPGPKPGSKRKPRKKD